ncbi:MAG: type VI secretion system-associated FHA domain protein TagH [Proteobacteria bacterium]|nr:type VI secretion system-associated FHA domain protein TagH [Pseudomonadota bacterium]
MSLQIEIVSEHAELVGEDAVCEFNEDGGTIGRSLRNDWILPDPDNFISGRHATIDYQGGIYYLADISSNGVYINDEDEPVGKGNPRRLFNGDRLRMGDFEMLVTIDTGEGLELPDPPKPTVVPDHIEQLVDEVSLRTGMQLLDEEEITGDDEFHSTLFGKPADKPEPKSKSKSKSKSSSKSKKTKKSLDMGVTAEDLFDSFLDGLGISRAELNPSVNRPELMLAAGQILREFVTGTTRLLSSRANLKNAFRLDQTTVLPRANNPIKFSENTNDLIKQLLVGSEGEYLGAQDAVREVCGDLLNHQNAFLDAMNSAFIEFADRFDPVELQEGFDRTIGSRFFGFATKVKYWQLYCDVYPIMTEKGGGRFPQMFGEEFVKAYERQVAEYRRLDREGTGSAGLTPQSHDQQSVEPDLKKTQKLVSADAEETAFDDDDIVAIISESGALEIDQSFIDDLENSMSEAVSADDLKP